MTKQMADRREVTDTEYYVLAALARGSRYGYAIRVEVERMTGGEKRLSLATLYDALHRLFQSGLIERGDDEQVGGRIRRTYRVAGAGEEALQRKYATAELIRGIHQLRTDGKAV